MAEKTPSDKGLHSSCRMEKSYRHVIVSGTTIKIHMTIEVDRYSHESIRQILKELAASSHNFYLETGKKLSNML